MESKARILKLFLKNGTLDGFFNVEDTNTIVSVYSCPRETIEDLINEEASEGYGVYFLLSENQVYVGQSTNLRKRIDQHKIGKLWWNRAILLTTKNDSLTRSNIDYLESEFIRKAETVQTIDLENKNKGIKQKIDKFDQEYLNKFINESLMILELIGITVFKSRVASLLGNSIKSKNPITEQDMNLLLKKEAVLFLKNRNIELESHISYGKLQERKNWFWINPDVEFLNHDWTIILNNQILRKIILLKVNMKTYKAALEKSKETLLLRKDKPNYIDLNINAGTLVDSRSKIDFSKHLIHEVSY
jgi:hypothetical protein